MDNEDKLTVFKILENLRFYCMEQKKNAKSARMKDAMQLLSEATERKLNPLCQQMKIQKIPTKKSLLI